MQLTRDNYFSQEANWKYMSASQFKSFVPAYSGCEAAALAKLKGEYEEPQRECFIEGHYIHAWNEGTLPEFKANNPEIYSSCGPTAGQLKSNYQNLNKMIEVLESDPLCMQALAGQKEVIMTAELFGIEWKIMIDSYSPDVGGQGMFADLKAIKAMDSKFWNSDAQCYENFIERYGYDIQMGIYAEIEKRATGRENWLIPHIVAVTKQDPPDHEIIWFDYQSISSSLQIVSNHIERVKAVKYGEVAPIRCETCEYCRLTKKIKKPRLYSEFSLY